MMHSIENLLKEGILKLKEVTDEAMLDAQLLLAHALNKPRSYLFLQSEMLIAEHITETYFNYLARRMDGEPIAYIIQQKSFWSLDLMVTTDTLIPRPETELLVELVLHHFQHEQQINFLDLGTGSGAIALSIAKEKPNWRIDASDVSDETLQVAQQNAHANDLTHIQFYK